MSVDNNCEVKENKTFDFAERTKDFNFRIKIAINSQCHIFKRKIKIGFFLKLFSTQFLQILDCKLLNDFNNLKFVENKKNCLKFFTLYNIIFNELKSVEMFFL